MRHEMATLQLHGSSCCHGRSFQGNGDGRGFKSAAAAPKNHVRSVDVFLKMNSVTVSS